MSLVIESKRVTFLLTLDAEASIISEQIGLLLLVTFAILRLNGANLILKQNVLFIYIIIIDGTSSLRLNNCTLGKLTDIGFKGVNITASTINRFDELLDTFSYFGNDQKFLRVKRKPIKLEAVAISTFTQADKDKLNGIETGAQVNVNPDWNSTDPNSKSTI
jgi:hypothetical protein